MKLASFWESSKKKSKHRFPALKRKIINAKALVSFFHKFFSSIKSLFSINRATFFYAFANAISKSSFLHFQARYSIPKWFVHPMIETLETYSTLFQFLYETRSMEWKIVPIEVESSYMWQHRIKYLTQQIRCE